MHSAPTEAEPAVLFGLSRQALGVFAFFFLEGFVIGNWIPRIPDVKALYGLSASGLGFALFALALGTLIAFLIAPRLLAIMGLARSCFIGLAAWTLCFFTLPFLPSVAVLMVIMLLGGVALGILEVAMNSAADREERRSGRRIMSRAHGFWSVGSLVGALAGGGTAALGLGLGQHFSIMMPFVILFGFVALWAVKDRIAQHAEPQPTDKGAVFAVPDRTIVLLCLFPVGVMMIEGAYIDWSALFIRDVLDGTTTQAGLIYATFSLSMAAMRLSGDWILERYDATWVARISCVFAMIGITLFALAPALEAAFAAAFFSGIGVAIIYPMAMSAAARRPGKPEDHVAAVSLFAFTAFMIAPPTLGFVIDTIGMRFALLCLVPLALMSLLLTRELAKGVAPSSPLP
ncbi:MAG: MFS transporter [Pseudomonadota bacterium]